MHEIAQPHDARPTARPFVVRQSHPLLEFASFAIRQQACVVVPRRRESRAVVVNRDISVLAAVYDQHTDV
jgi:hypothetical protein